MTTPFPKSNIQWLPLDDLKVHPRAQRQFNEQWGKQLAAAFDPDAFGVLLVVENTNGDRLIVDGQHRAYAARVALGPNQKVQCDVHKVADDSGAARIFLAGNRHKSVGTLDKFLVRVIANDPTAIGVMDTLKRHGLTTSRTRADGIVQAVDACESIYKRPNGSEVFDRTISVLCAAWGRNPDAFHAHLVRGVGTVLAKHGADIDTDELARKLSKSSGPLRVVGQVRDLMVTLKVSAKIAAMVKVVQVYNQAKRTGKLPETLAA